MLVLYFILCTINSIHFKISQVRRASSIISSTTSTAATAAVSVASATAGAATNAGGWLAGKLTAGVSSIRGYVGKARSGSTSEIPAEVDCDDQEPDKAVDASGL